MSSSDFAIRIVDIGKQYRLGFEQSGGMYRYKSLRDSIGGIVRSPIKALRNKVIAGPMNESNSFWALKEVSFDVKRGEVVGIIGRNGAGKSTLLKILSRITRPTTGEIELHGRVGSLLEVGTGFHPELTGRENIYLNGAVLGMTRAEVRRKFDEIVAFSEIERFIDTPVKQYSSGMYTRLAFAVAAHLEPEILVVDEVLAVGDAQFQRKCLGKMKDVAGEGRTVLFVSHNMGAIRELCDFGCLLSKGQMLRAGEIDEVTRHYMATAHSSTHAIAADLPDQTFVGPARIHSCSVQQAGISEGADFSPEKPIRFVCEVEHQRGAFISLGIRIRNAHGQEILHVTSQDEVDALQLPDDRSRLMIDLPPVPLNDNDYYATIYLGDRAFQLQHLLNDAVAFRINTVYRGHRYAKGPLAIASNWSWEK